MSCYCPSADDGQSLLPKAKVAKYLKDAPVPGSVRRPDWSRVTPRLARSGGGGGGGRGTFAGVATRLSLLFFLRALSEFGISSVWGHFVTPSMSGNRSSGNTFYNNLS